MGLINPWVRKISGRRQGNPPGSSVHGILQAGRLEWVALSSSRDFPDPGIIHASDLRSHVTSSGKLSLG